MTLVKQSSIQKDGKDGEIAFKNWLNSQKIGYLYISQEIEYFAKVFQNDFKRPDFLILLPRIGFISIDVKHHDVKSYDNKDCFTLNIKQEVDRAVNFEDFCKVPIWYAYKKKNDKNDSAWYFISAYDAISKGEIRHSQKTDDDYLSIELKDFKLISKSEDLSKLLNVKLENNHTLKDAQEKMKEKQDQAKWAQIDINNYPD
jgi:hypothetical protein